MSQIHKSFTTDQVKDLFNRYISKAVERKYIQELLGVKKSQFFLLLKEYRDNSKNFSIDYSRFSPKKISPEIEANILKILAKEKTAIEDKDTPLKHYNYSSVKDRLENKHNQTVSVTTIINRAKENDFYIQRKKYKKAHDREVLTNYIGELIQHDSSYHLFAPDTGKKWCLITSLDDYSRYMFYAKFVERESTWDHINALSSVVIKHGCPYAYYTDCHSIFRYVRGRDQRHHKFTKFTDDVDPQWKQVLKECGIKPVYALSPQAKGKIERPYQWLQDRIVRTCIHENVKDIAHAQRVLNAELDRYNHRQLHSTTKEIPYLRFKNAKEQKKSLFREFKVPAPFLTVKDIFALRASRTVDPYCKININTWSLRLKDVEPRQFIDIRVYPLDNRLIELRFWCRGKFLESHRVKMDDLGLSDFNL